MVIDFHARFLNTQQFARVSAYLLVLAGISAMGARAQGTCVSPERIQTLRNAIENDKAVLLSTALRDEILAMQKSVSRDPPSLRPDSETQRSSDQKAAETTKHIADRICAFLQTQPWPSRSLVGTEAASAWIGLIKSHLDPQVQLTLTPVVLAGVTRGEISRDQQLAGFIDRLRVRAGQAQLFGTQASMSDGFLVLWPLQSEESVDEWRKAYGLGTLKDYIQGLQYTYKMPVIRSTTKASRVAVPEQRTETATSGSELLQIKDNAEEVVRVETSIVIVDATVFGQTVPTLGKSDFKIYEDGQEQEITVFNAPSTPFDIVLLLDLSGSTENMVGLIKKTTRQFIEMKRDVDRVAIVTFTGTQTVISPLESDKAKLLNTVSNIKDTGASHVWDAGKFAIDLLKNESSSSRRKAVVVMTDGVDNALMYEPGWGSRILFADLVEEVRNSSVAFFPIYLDTQQRGRSSERIYNDARRTLQLLADESGGNYYMAKDIGNLNEVYERVMRDVGRVYSLGYEPKDARKDGRWRSIRVEIRSHPEIKVRARTGYYAK